MKFGSSDISKIYFGSSQVSKAMFNSVDVLSSFVPTDIANLVLWLDASDGLTTDTDLLTPVANDGDAIAGWIDKSGAGNHLTQATAGNKPVYKVNQQNGKPIARFTAANTSTMTRTTHTISPTAPATVFVVAKQSQSANEGAIVAWQTGSSKGYTFRNFTNTYRPRFTLNSKGHLDVPIACWSPNRFDINCVVWDTSHKASFYTNGVSKSSSSYASDSNSGDAAFRIGSTGNTADNYSGDIAEIIIYDAVLSDTDRNKVEAFLSAKYAIGVTTIIANAANHLTITTYDGSGQATHPAIIDFGASPWNGYRYWMAMTPYPGADSTKENPSILVSNDGTTWSVPTGLTNPIQARPATGWNSDPDLLMSADGTTMYCIYRHADTAKDDIYVESSTDGITWGDRALLYSAALNEGISPTIVWDGTQFVMWVIDDAPNETCAITRYTCATLTGEWSAATVCTIANPAPRPWHICARKYGSTYYMMVCEKNQIAPTPTYGIYLLSSSDGITWEYDTTFRLGAGATGAWDAARLYRASFTKTGSVFDIWYSVIDASNQWWIGKTQYTMPAA